jgi:hypothetical protein
MDYRWRSPSKALDELVADGYDIPDLLPETFINCENRQEAAKLF